MHNLNLHFIKKLSKNSVTLSRPIRLLITRYRIVGKLAQKVFILVLVTFLA